MGKFEDLRLICNSVTIRKCKKIIYLTKILYNQKPFCLEKLRLENIKGCDAHGLMCIVPSFNSKKFCRYFSMK